MVNFNDDDGLPNAYAARKIAQRTLTHFITFAMNDPPCERLEMSGAAWYCRKYFVAGK